MGIIGSLISFLIFELKAFENPFVTDGPFIRWLYFSVVIGGTIVSIGNLISALFYSTPSPREQHESDMRKNHEPKHPQNLGDFRRILISYSHYADPDYGYHNPPPKDFNPVTMASVISAYTLFVTIFTIPNLLNREVTLPNIIRVNEDGDIEFTWLKEKPMALLIVFVVDPAIARIAQVAEILCLHHNIVKDAEIVATKALTVNGFPNMEEQIKIKELIQQIGE